MEQTLYERWKAYSVRNRNRRILQKVVQVLGCIVVFCTTYALILPAITMEQEAFCGLEEHIHDESCYQMTAYKSTLVCSADSMELHVHNSGCYNSEGVLSCATADYVAHNHNDSCYDEMQNLVCTLPVRGVHSHSDSCYAPGETQPVVLHVHTEDCYTSQQGELICAQEEYEGHTHGDACYAPSSNLICSVEEGHVHADNCYTYPLNCNISTEPHVHSSDCYTTGQQICSIEEGHVHGEGCYELEQTCTNEEEGHEHGSECYTSHVICSIPENHVHDDNCYESIISCGKNEGDAHAHGAECYSTEAQLICQIQENHSHDDSCYSSELVCTTPESPGHTHDNDCYQWNSVTICGMEEGEPEPTEPADPVLICTEPIAQVHTHGEGCFAEMETSALPICGQEHEHHYTCYPLVCQMDEHTHELACYSDETADVESVATWEATMQNVILTGIWEDDVVAIAESQLGYTESTRNYAVWEDNSIHGYTRYGAWYGVPHGDWCGMFASFCLNYAGVEGMPLNYGVRPWIEDLAEMELYYTADTAEPQKGHLVFYDWEGDGLSDHVGIVAEIEPATEYSVARLKAIEGNASNCVKYVTYDLDDPVLLGYSRLPEKPEIEEEEEVEVQKEIEEEQPAEPSTVTASIYTDETYSTVAEDNTVITLTGILPEGAKVYAYPVVVESELEFVCAYDISILLPDGTLHEPAEGEMISVNISNPALETSEAELAVYYIPEEGEPNLLESDVKSDSVVFDTDHFSVYGVAKTAVLLSDSNNAENDASSTPITATIDTEDNTASNTVITLTGLPQNVAKVTATPVPAANLTTTLKIKLAYDIKLYDTAGAEYTLKDGESATVTIADPTIAVAEGKLTVYYFPGEGEPQKVETIVSDNAVTFTINHFSTYGVVEGDVITATIYDSSQWPEQIIQNHPNTITVTGVPSDTVVKAYPITVAEERIGVLCSYKIKFYEADGTTAFTPTDAEVKIQCSGVVGADAPYTVYEFIDQWSFGSRKACKANLTSSPFTFNTSYSDYCYAVTYVPVSTIEIPVYTDSKMNTQVDGVTMTATGRFPTVYSMKAYADFATAIKNVLYSYRIFSHEQYNYAKEIPYDGPEMEITISTPDVDFTSSNLAFMEFMDDGTSQAVDGAVINQTDKSVTFTTNHLSSRFVLLDNSTLPVVTKQATIYTDNTLTAKDETSAAKISVSGSFPDSVEARAYPVKVIRNSDIIFGYHVGLYHNGKVISETVPLDISIQHADLKNTESYPKKLLNVNSDLKSWASDAAATFDTVNGNATFKMNANSMFAVELDTDNILTELQVDFVEDDAYDSSYDSVQYISSEENIYGYEVFCSTHIFIKRGNQYYISPYSYNGNEEMTVRITSDNFNELTGLEIYFIKDDQKTKIETLNQIGNVISFQTTPAQIADKKIIVVKPLDNVDETITTADDFIKFFDSEAPEVKITLGNNIILNLENSLEVKGNVIIDLNGYTLDCSNSSSSIFNVSNGNLTIQDSANENGSASQTLEYSYMDSNVVNSYTGLTSESIINRSISGGAIQAGSSALINANGGTVTITGGMLHSGTGRAIVADGTQVNLQGGCIYKFISTQDGGAVHIKNGTLNITGNAVIAQNHSDRNGGAIYTENTAVRMNGGYIVQNDCSSPEHNNGESGTTSDGDRIGGGGIALSGGSMDITGGYISLNECKAFGYWGGGGGIMTMGNTALSMSGGYVTGNEAGAGGGIKLKDWSGGGSFTMTGGFVCSNRANYAEGGGISIGGQCVSHITSGYVNHNHAECLVDWGGGGIFVANDANLFMKNALITDNGAGGFGAGVAGCSTARMHIAVTDGAAIFDNTASGRNTSGKNSTKNQDWIYAKGSPTFMANGYQDVFSALNCTVEGAMLGGKAANWSGSCDGAPVSLNATTGVISSQSVLGLTSDPTTDAKDDARTTVRNKNGIYIIGNTSYTHGGGILCNGYLIIGTANEDTVPEFGSRIELVANKSFLVNNSEVLKDTTVGVNARNFAGAEFEFAVYQITETEGTESRTLVATGKNNSSGKIDFSTQIPFNQEGTYTFEIYEIQPENVDSSVIYDSVKYQMIVTIESKEIQVSGYEYNKAKQYIVKAVVINKWDAEQNYWVKYKTFNPDENQSPAYPINVDLNPEGGRAFTNCYNPETTSFTVTKKWGAGKQLDSVKVALMQNDSQYGEKITLSIDNQWTHTWTDLPVADDSGNVFSYTIKEDDYPDFDVAYTPESGKINEYIITNTEKIYSIDLTKVTPRGEKLAGAEFNLLDTNEQPLYFVKNLDTGKYEYAKADADNTEIKLITNEEGKLLVTGLPQGTYILKETIAPTGFELAEAVEIKLDDDSLKDNSFLEDLRTKYLTIVDELEDYSLPETGGAGTTLYTMSGMLLIAVALVMYIQTKRKREAV